MSNGNNLANLARKWVGTEQSFGAAGYQKLPSGLILQWGTRAMDATTGPHQVTFPIAFPNACLTAMAQNNGNAYATLCGSLTTTTMNLSNGSAASGAGTAMWWAIGH